MDQSTLDTSVKLNIAAIAAQTRALGPGLRAVIWVQGCPFHCPGCIAPGWIPFTPANIMDANQILDRLDMNAVDGITFSGGEPMAQANGLAIFARIARKIKDVNLICFTGYRYEQLIKNPPNEGVLPLLSELDVLIDGPYIQARNDSIGLRGSSNQRIIHLTSRMQQFDLEKQKRSMEVTIKDGELSFVGIPTPAVKAALDLARETSVKG